MAAVEGGNVREGGVRPEAAPQTNSTRVGQETAERTTPAPPEQTQRAERDILALSPTALARQSRLDTAQFERNIDEERANLIALQAQQRIASADSITGANDESRQLIAYLS